MVEMGMVERVARALARLSDDLGYDEEKWLYCVQDARGAIEAMREPTDAMAVAVGVQYGSAFQDGWYKMIDAALTEPAAPSPIPGPSENTANTSAQPQGE